MRINGAALIPDLSGALYWPDAGMLFVADLHFEKGSSFARRGHLLPPHDTLETIRRLSRLIDRWRPATVVCLGDSFHDQEAEDRLAAEDAAAIRTLTESCDWVWILGNHDPVPPGRLGGRAAETIDLGPFLVRHAPVAGDHRPELAGHLHPKAALRVRGRRISRRCFVGNGMRAVLPSFGAYTGGLNVTDPAFGPLFPGGFEAHLIGARAIHRIPSSRLLSAA